MPRTLLKILAIGASFSIVGTVLSVPLYFADPDSTGMLQSLWLGAWVATQSWKVVLLVGAVFALSLFSPRTPRGNAFRMVAFPVFGAACGVAEGVLLTFTTVHFPVGRAAVIFGGTWACCALFLAVAVGWGPQVVSAITGLFQSEHELYPPDV